jgi:hypothetical protein
MSPVLALTAITWPCGVLTNMMPLFTIGGAWWPSSTPVDSVQTGTSSLTFSLVIWSSGL